MTLSSIISDDFQSGSTTDMAGNSEFGMSEGATKAAIAEWTKRFHPDQLVVDDGLLKEHGQNAYGSSVRAIAVIRARSEDDVVTAVRVADRHQVGLYPISTGNNWGYGAATPSVAGCAVLDLSALNAIRTIDEEMGLFALQPGVTQGQLYRFLEEANLPFMVPVHGGGPDCSILGNALERGYGLTPIADHFDALTSLRAILANGETYCSPFQALNQVRSGGLHRWGIGPYVEGLFSQGNFGVVTEATFVLKKRPEHVEAFFCRLDSNERMNDAVDRVHSLLATMPGIVTGINFMNSRRVLSMSRPYPTDLGPTEVISDEDCERMVRAAGFGHWTIAGVIHCPKALRKSVRHQVRNAFAGVARRPMFVNRSKLNWFRKASGIVPKSNELLSKQLNSVESLLDLASGKPRTIALNLAYWIDPTKRPSDDKPLNPARDGCGLIWYSPLVPMKSDCVRTFSDLVDTTCKEFGIEPLITLTTLSERLFDATVPLLYRPDDHDHRRRAHECYEALFSRGASLGFMPYRLGTKTTSQIANLGDDTHWPTVAKLKHALDPNGIIAPGRYSRNQ